jgi:hypothetical protein
MTSQSDSSPDVSPLRQASGAKGVPMLGVKDEPRDRKPPKITVKSVRDKPLEIDMEPADAVRLLSAFGTEEAGFATLMLSGIINAACEGGPDHDLAGHINDALAAATGIGARDEIEGMVAVQMIATHVAAIRVLRQLKGSETIVQQNSNGSLAVKLLRTFSMQLEALQRYRGKGQQKVTVEHVHVNAGGQAIVGAMQPLPVKKCTEPM